MRHIHKLTAAAVLISIAAPSTAAVMNAEEFYQRATKIKKKGALAMLSMKEVKLLVNEVKIAGAKVKETRIAAERAGKKGRYCPPTPAKNMSSDDYYAGLAAIPQAARKRMDLVEATTQLLAAKFPCRG